MEPDRKLKEAEEGFAKEKLSTAQKSLVRFEASVNQKSMKALQEVLKKGKDLAGNIKKYPEGITSKAIRAYSKLQQDISHFVNEVRELERDVNKL